MRFLIGIDAVKVHHLQKRLVGYGPYRKIVYFRACSVRKEFDVELEVFALQLICAE